MENLVLLDTVRKAKNFNGCINIDVIRDVSHKLGIPISQVAGVASFYSEFNGMDDGEIDESMVINKDILSSEMPPSCINTSSYGEYKAYEMIKNSPAVIIDAIKKSGLRGRGGSGFPVWIKWSTSSVIEGKNKYIICNASEGETDTYKDLWLMLNYPHAIIEGMLICALAVHADKGYVYIRSEYKTAQRAMQDAVNKAYSMEILGHGFDIEVFASAGGYVCGEETALISSIEGKRGEPRLKPPYPGVSGLLAKPTVINNAESFAYVPSAILSKKVNTKLYTVCGAVEKPGVYELEYGITARRISELCGAGDIKGFQLGGGVSGRFCGLDKLDVPLTVEGCTDAGLSLGTGSVKFISKECSMLQLLEQSANFLESQSCGKCVPCRCGLPKVAEILRKYNAGFPKERLAELKELCAYISDSSRCALGASIAPCLDSIMWSFLDELITSEDEENGQY